MSFHPTKNLLLVCYTNRKIIEFDFDLNEYTDWSRQNSDSFPKQWNKKLTRHHKLLNCFYHNQNLDKILVNDEHSLAIIDKNEKISKMINSKIIHKKKVPNGKSRMEEEEKEEENDEDEDEDEDKSHKALQVSHKYRVCQLFL
jgi:hypothetical protein